MTIEEHGTPAGVAPRACALSVSHLTKCFGDIRAVDDLDLTVGEGELFALLGVNGAGKTTTIRMLTALTAPTSGSATVLGFDLIRQNREVRAVSGVSPQQTAVAGGLTVRENLMMMARIFGYGREEAKARADALIAQFSLSEVENRRAKVLSGGYQRRLSIALALVGQPKILYLDEPTLGLDVLARRELWALISGLKGSMTVILTTHYLEEAEALSDRVGVMAGGKLLALDTPAALKARAGCGNFEDAFVKIVGGEVSLS